MTRYRWVAARKAEGFPIRMAAKVAEVSRQAFHDWRARQAAGPTAAELAEVELVELMREIHAEHDGTYGVPRMTHELALRGRPTNRKRVERLMRLHGIVGVYKPAKVRTTIPAEGNPPMPDLIGRNFTPAAPDVAWCGDITYIRTGEGWLYLASVLDLGSRRLLGYSMADHMRTELVANALEMAAGQRSGVTAQIIFHGDRGSQGELNRSSQHLPMMEVRDGATTADGGSGASPGDALAGAADPGAPCRARVLAADRRGQEHRGRRWRCRGVGPGRVALVSSCWRDDSIALGRADRPVLVVC